MVDTCDSIVSSLGRSNIWRGRTTLPESLREDRTGRSTSVDGGFHMEVAYGNEVFAMAGGSLAARMPRRRNCAGAGHGLRVELRPNRTRTRGAAGLGGDRTGDGPRGGRTARRRAPVQLPARRPHRHGR